MRIIRGKYKTRYYRMPKGFPSRPTTDFAKEGLFNILENQYLTSDMQILDLCTGTGNIAMEFLSREAGKVVAVDINYNCIRHLKTVAKNFDCENDIHIIKSDILKYLDKSEKQFDLIFADPPYAYEHHKEIVAKVFALNKLKEDGVLIVEHGKETDLSKEKNFTMEKTYGNIHFSFFDQNED